MRKLTDAVRRTRKRKAIVGALVTLLVVAASASAYYLIFGNGEGSGSATLGSGTAEPLTLSATFENGLTPGGEEWATIIANNPTKSLGKVGHLAATVLIDPTHAAAGCQASWFTLSGMGFSSGTHTEGELTTPVEIASKEYAQVAALKLKFSEEGVNQSSCEGATLTIKVKSEP